MLEYNVINTESMTNLLDNPFDSFNKPYETVSMEETAESEGTTIMLPIPSSQLEVNDSFFGTITTNVNNKRTRITSHFKVLKKNESGFTFRDLDNPEHPEYKSSRKGTEVKSNCSQESQQRLRQSQNTEAEIKKAEKEALLNKFKEEARKEATTMSIDAIDFSQLEPEDKLRRTIDAGIDNIWMVGPAGCGKSTMARNVAKEKELPYLCISCGIGTSAAEFVGYKYPTREATKFAEYYAKPSIILIDEFTALDPSVAQVVNAALANGEIETTTGLVKRHPECIIIATSNTFGSGADRQYVANNQLDASTIDRFIGGIIEVDYSESYESQYDAEVVFYVNKLRKIIKENNIRRVASTRMIQAGHRLKKCSFLDWKQRLIISWTDNEKQIIQSNMENFVNEYIEYRGNKLLEEFLEYKAEQSKLQEVA
jgi:ATP-dependent Clp protease ATP-binding subunit ClpA